jgi:hypothetical protein
MTNPIDEQMIGVMRQEIARNGRCILMTRELHVICSPELPVGEQFMCIAGLARRERWSFTLTPTSTVIFAPLAE